MIKDMDYSVGSLSDLITGNNTPNKKKVVTKKFSLKNSESIVNESTDLSNEENLDNEVVKRKKANRKHKLDDNSEDEPKLKKTKNNKNAERRVALKEKPEKQIEDPEKTARTVYVGNVPITCDQKKIKRFFMKYGNVECVRIRGVPVANPKTPKKVAFIKKDFHASQSSYYSYVRFEKREEAEKAAAEANGQIFHDHHLRVHLCVGENKPDESKAIFVGNLSFDAGEEDLWKTFEHLGPIASVRIPRDKTTRIGKGFGYVNFQNSDSVTLALEMENVKLKDRELRISICNVGAAKKNKKTGKAKKINKPGKPRKFNNPSKKDSLSLNNDNVEVENESAQKKVNSHKKAFKNTGDGDADKTIIKKSFQGVTSVEKKKKTQLNKSLIQKKKLVKKIAPK